MIGAGIFVLPGQLAPYGVTGIAAWGVAIAGTLTLAIVISRLIAARPGATGAPAVIGEALGPLAAVLVGWSYWVGIWSANAILAQTAVRYLSVFFPVLAVSGQSIALWSIGLLWLITVINLGGAKAAGRFQLVTTILKLLPLIAVIGIFAWVAAAGGPPQAPALAPFAIGDLGAATALAFYALVGFEAAGVAAERVRDPARNVARATLLGMTLTGALYIAVCAAIAIAIPADRLAASAAPVALFVETYLGRGASLAVAGFAVIAAVGCLNGWILLQGEHPLGMARAGLLPAAFAKTGARDVPVRMLVLASLCASTVLFFSVSAEGGLLGFMLNLTAAATLWFYTGCCLAALKLRVAMVPALAGLAFCAWALLGSGKGALLSLALMAMALPLYWWARRSSLPIKDLSASTS